jgi:hypothetical protein
VRNLARNLFNNWSNQLLSRITGNQELSAVTFRLTITLLLALLVAACSSAPPLAKPDPLRQASAVSVTMPGFITSQETTLRWQSDLKWEGNAEGQYNRRAQVMQQALQREFEQKGYRFVASDEAATYDVFAIALMGQLRDQEELERVFRLYPSLEKPAKGYGRGTVLVAIAPAGTRDIVWRGALEVFTNPDKMPVAERDQRMEWAAGQLLRSIPGVP